MQRHGTLSSSLVEALEAFWNTRRPASRLEVDNGTGASQLSVTSSPASERPSWSAWQPDADGSFRVR